ncbi:sigma-70 region 4 domain-containing protein [Patescibacteria group bacterium]|nr:sigma-70 region 4 domain-containing protein [Patescibacteria group bacterium]
MIYMKFVEEYSYEEIAKILKSSEQTIRQKVSR